MHREAAALRRAVAEDVPLLMAWFPDARSADLWSGPSMRFPFTRETFAEDMRWDDVASYSLRGAGEELLGFGQIYERYGRVHLARLAVNPARRARGWGRGLTAELVRQGHEDFGLDECGLYVYGNNLPAIACYRASGFKVTESPEITRLGDRVIYMTRPVAQCE